MLYIIGNCKNELFKLFIESIDRPVSIIPFEEVVANHKITRIAQLLWKFNIFLKWQLFPSFFYDKIKKIPQGSDVIFFTIYPLAVMNTMAYMPKNVNCKIWFWDSFSTIDCPANKIVNLLRKLKLPLFTYDSADARNYNLNFIPQFFIKDFLVKNILQDADIDFYFLGTVKNRSRLDRLSQIESTIDKLNYKKDIRVVRSPNEYITYAENISNVRNARCLIEINSEGQFGLTLRAMEALFLRKKLITNNAEIKNYDFYSENNIYIWGEDNRSLDEFMETPYSYVPEEVILKYDINQWLINILKHCGL